MGRRKTYDRDELVLGAMALFWRQGYERTTIGDLEQTLGVNRYSLFSEFQSKDGLFEVALDAYEAQVVSTTLGPLEEPDADVDRVVVFLERFRASAGDMSGAGCMLCNAAVQGSPDPELIRVRFGRYSARLCSALANALGDAPDRPRRAAAAALASGVVGLFVQARGGASAAVLGEALDGLQALVRGLD